MAGRTSFNPNTVHLHVVDQDPVGNPHRCDHFWSKDFASYRVVPLLWWDDASYIAYQADPGAEYEDFGEAPVAPVTSPTEPYIPVDPDDIPF